MTQEFIDGLTTRVKNKYFKCLCIEYPTLYSRTTQLKAPIEHSKLSKPASKLHREPCSERRRWTRRPGTGWKGWQRGRPWRSRQPRSGLRPCELGPGRRSPSWCSSALWRRITALRSSNLGLRGGLLGNPTSYGIGGYGQPRFELSVVICLKCSTR